jgi:hypothetical protein
MMRGEEVGLCQKSYRAQHVVTPVFKMAMLLFYYCVATVRTYFYNIVIIILLLLLLSSRIIQGL